jgi:hypothetical protein
MTDANGQITVTYTASTNSVSCEVIASEAIGGTSDFATVTQGAASMTSPSIDAANFPTAITAGAATPVTFTTTASNPSSSDIAGALVTIYLAGDDNATTGIDSSQVNLSYSDSSTGGQFVSVPVTGTTINDGVISGSTLPATGSTLAAGTSNTTTWHLSLVGGTAGSANTKPLILEADLDEIDPASGADTNLDYTNTSLPVIPGSTVTPPVVTPTTVTNNITQPTDTIIETVPATLAAAAKCTVPKLVGTSPATARARLTAAKCTSVTLIEPNHSKKQTLVVKSASPKAGTQLPAGGTLTVVFKTVTTKHAKRH